MHTHILVRLFVCVTLWGIGNAFARPLVVESHQQLPFNAEWLALSGNELISMSYLADSSTGTTFYTYTASLRTRNAAGSWPVTQVLMNEVTETYLERPRVALQGNVAAVFSTQGLRIFERAGASWVERIVDLPARPQGNVVQIDGNSVFITELGCSVEVRELRRLANGHWAPYATLTGNSTQCVTAMDFEDNRAIVRQMAADLESSSVRIFERAGAGWTVLANVTGNESNPQNFGQSVAIRESLALISGSDLGAYVYRRGAAGWTFDGHFPNPGAGEWGHDGSIHISDDYIVRIGSDTSRYSSVALVYRELPDQTFEHLASLVGDRENPLSLGFLSGNRVMGLTGDHGNQVLELEIPTSFATPPLVQYTFQSLSTAPWVPLAGSEVNIVGNGTSFVYRQGNASGDAGSVHPADMTNQSIAADIRINAFNGADRWVGLMTRYVDESNYYYVTLRDSNQVVLKRMLDGVFTELARAPVSIAPGESVHLRLESSGTRHQVYVDGQQQGLCWAFDDSLSHGRTGVRMYKAAADYDNIVISPGPTLEQVYAFRETRGGTWTGTPIHFAQTSVTATARRTTGWPREDQSVQALVRIDNFAGTGTPWVGLMARYVDEGNYYYVTVRKTNELSLRKLTNGAITVLGTVPFAAVPRQSFVLRLDAIGDQVRVYVNGAMRLESGNAEVVAGKVGVMTYRAAAAFTQYTAHEP